jgi:hypothetical protein
VHVGSDEPYQVEVHHVRLLQQATECLKRKGTKFQ